MSATKIGPRMGFDESEAVKPRRSVRAPAADIAVEEPPLLVQIPDFDQLDDPVHDDPSDGRIISQALSRRLVVGGGLLLVVIALLGVAMNRKGSRSVVDELPVKTEGIGTNGAPVQVFVPDSGTPGAPGGGAGQGTIYEAQRTSPAYLTPQPQVGTNRPMALGDPAWPSTGRPETANPGANDRGAGFDQRAYQADARNDAAAGYRDNPRDPLRSDPRYGSPSGQRDYGGAGQLGNALMPSPAHGAGGLAPAPSAVEPGTARLQGIIETPPVRNANDRSGSSIY